MGFLDRLCGFSPKSDVPRSLEKSVEKSRREILLSELKDSEIITDQDRVFAFGFRGSEACM